MLILSRKTGEAVRIDDQIRVVVRRVSRGRVTLSIDAPTHVGIRREELEHLPAAQVNARQR